MEFDTNNPVIKLCAEGMQLEAQGQIGKAHILFNEAWTIAKTDFEKFTSAHYMARNQDKPEVELDWNQKCLKHALALNNEHKNEIMPSLYLNIGKSFEKLHDMENAKIHYQSAASYMQDLPGNAYGDMLRSGIKAALQRVGAVDFKNDILESLIDQWCDSRELRPLSLVLPAYLGNIGTESDLNKLISALSFLSATRCLKADHQKKIDQVISNLAN